MPLRTGGRLAWVELLGYVKAHGIGGRVKALAASSSSRRWNIPARDVEAMLRAAHNDGALETKDGDWVITNWGRYQEVDNTAAERMRKHRALRRNVTKGSEENGARAPRKDPLRRNDRNVRGVPSRDRDVDVDVDVDSDRKPREHARAGSATPDFDGYTPTDAQRARATELGVDLDPALRKWRGNRKAAGLNPVDLVADFDSWLEREPGYANGNGAHAEPAGRPTPAPYEPEPDPELTADQRAEIARLARETAEKLSAPAPEPRKRLPQLTREEQLEIARKGKL